VAVLVYLLTSQGAPYLLTGDEKKMRDLSRERESSEQFA
jgi:hypothetical protein